MAGGRKPRRPTHPSRFTNLDLYRLAITLSALGEPFGKSHSQPLRVNAQASLQCSFASGKGVVEFRRASEVAHAESIEPVKWTCPALARDNNFHFELPRIHREAIIASEVADAPSPRLAPMPQPRGGLPCVSPGRNLDFRAYSVRHYIA